MYEKPIVIHVPATTPDSEVKTLKEDVERVTHNEMTVRKADK